MNPHRKVQTMVASSGEFTFTILPVSRLFVVPRCTSKLPLYRKVNARGM